MRVPKTSKNFVLVDKTLKKQKTSLEKHFFTTS